MNYFGLRLTHLASFAILLLLSSSACSITVNNNGESKNASSSGKKDPKQDKDEDKPKPEKSKPKPKPEKKPKPDKKPEPKPEKPKPEKPKPQPSAADRDDDASKPAPVPEPTPAPVPPLPDGVTQIVVPVRVDFDAAVAKVDELIEQTSKQGWKLVTKPGSSPAVEVKYTMWREPIKASFDDHTLKVTVPVRYAADVRAQIKNPLGGKMIWVTHGETWGTKDEPQHLSARFHANVSLQDDLHVKADMKLDDLDHGKAPSGDVCIKAIAKLCVSKESLAPMVRKNIDKTLKPKLQRALDKAASKIEETLALQARATSLWNALQKPLSVQELAQASCPTDLGSACKTPAWLVLQPTTLGFEQPRMDGKDLRVDLAITGKLEVSLGDKPNVKAVPLPKLQPITQPPGFSVSAKLRLPFEVLGKELEKALEGKDFGDAKKQQITIKSVKLIDESNVAKYPHRISLLISVDGALKADLTLTGELEYDEKSRELSVKSFEYSVESEALAVKQLASFNHDKFKKQVTDKAHWKLGSKTAALGGAITTALSSALRDQLKVSGELSKLELKSFRVQTDAITADIVLAGELSVAFTPK